MAVDELLTKGNAMCDCEPVEFQSRKSVLGRKPHRCCECLRMIPVGERQMIYSGKFDGHFFSERVCVDCEAMRKEMDIECYCLGELIEEAIEGDYDHLDSVVAFLSARRANWDAMYPDLAAKRYAMPKLQASGEEY
jgi:hypothetical protein